MRIHVVSDVHYRTEGLAAAGRDCDLFLCLGDLILFLDYDDPRHGIFADTFGEDNTRRYIGMRYDRRFDEARAFSRELWEALGAEPWTVISERVDAQYAELFALMPSGYLTYGNVDVPALWSGHTRPDHHVLDGQAVTLEGIRFGFVGGGLRTPMRTPFEITDEEYAAKVHGLGPVDVLCTHIPPAVPDATFDVVARRMERGSRVLREYIGDVQPRFVVHGHVHQPQFPRITIGRSQVINVGHFRATGRPYVLGVD